MTGSLTPGKRADVLADGRILKRGGALVTLDVDRISAQARQALARVRARAA